MSFSSATNTRILLQNVARSSASLSANAPTRRSKHSSTQIKRLFKNHPATRRRNPPAPPLAPPEQTIPPLENHEVVILPNGWSKPATVDVPEYPFRVGRTGNKPNDAAGFLPVYTERRKDGAKVTTRIKRITGDKEIFLSELRAVLKMPAPKSGNFMDQDEYVRIRTGGTIEVKGNHTNKIREWLTGLGF